jgi:uncharacterized protein YndB with AHSA1/START domain
MSIVSVEKDYDRLRLILVAEFDAPVERVWQLWADPRQLERWWGPPTNPATVGKHDLAPGGEVTFAMTGAEGEVSRSWWRVTAVDPPASLEFIDGFATEDGTPDTAAPITSVQVQLSGRDGGTRMELRFVYASREDMEQMERFGTFEGIRRSAAQMDAVLSS